MPGYNENSLDYTTDPGGEVHTPLPEPHPTQNLTTVGEGREESSPLFIPGEGAQVGKVAVSVWGQKRG